MNVIWDASANSGYTNDITIIGEDDNSGLDQRISKNSRPGTGSDIPWVTLATTNNFVAANSDSNRTPLGNGNFMAISSDTGTTEFETTFEGVADSRMNKVWKVSETGTVNNIFIAIPKTGPTKYFNTSDHKIIVISTDDTFDLSDNWVKMKDGGTHYYAEINPADGNFFTFASVEGFDISGTVFVDANDNDTNDGETGLENVTISLFDDVNNNDAYDMGTDTLVGSPAVTASDGTYSFDNQLGEYLIIVDDADTDLNSSTTYGASMATTKAISISDADLTDQDFGFQEATVTLSTPATEIAEENSATFVVTATLSIATAFETTINLEIDATSEATDDVDFENNADNTAINNTDLSISAGSTTATITIKAIEDTVVEGDENIVLNIDTVTNATENGEQQLSISITDDDEATVAINSPAAVNEGEDITFTVTLSGGSVENSFDIPVSITNGSSENEDYTALDAGAKVTFPANSDDGDTQTFTVSTTDDSIAEEEEDFTLDLGTPTISDITAPAAGASGTGTINTSDSATVAIDSPTAVAEGGDIVFTVTLSGAVEDTFDVPISLTDDTTDSDDYTALVAGAKVTFPANAADGDTQSVTVSISDDTEVEGDETFDLTLGTPSLSLVTAPAAGNEGTGTIENDDTATVSISSAATADEGDTMSFTVTLNGDVQDSFDVPLSITDIETDSGDYTALASGAKVSFGADASDGDTQTIEVATTDDNLVESSETFTLDLGTPSNSSITAESGNDKGTGTINSEDTATVSINDPTEVTEGGDIVFTITLSGGVQDAFDVPLSITDVSTSSTDYTAIAAGAKVTFDENSADGSTKTFTVTTVDDSTSESTETFTLDMGTPTLASVSLMSGEENGTGTIADNDTVGFSLTKSSFTLEEDGGEDTFDVTLNTSPVSDVVLNISTDDDTQADVNVSSLTFTSANYDVAQTVTVTAIPDTDLTTDTATITISVDADNSDDAYDAVEDKTVEVTLANDDFNLDNIEAVEIDENEVYTSVTPSINGETSGVVVYSLGGIDASDFSINETTGVVTKTDFDFESPSDDDSDNVYEISITATDENDNSATESWTITVKDVLETVELTLSGISNSSVNENEAYTSTAYSLSGMPIGDVSYSLIGADASLFTLNESSMQVEMVAKNFEAPEDMDTNNVYEVGLEITDEDDNSDSLNWTVSVADVQETVSLTLSGISNSTVNENTAYESNAYSVSGPPIGEVSYSLSGADASLFVLDENNMKVSMAAKDYEMPVDANTDNVYEVVLEVEDEDENMTTLSWTVTVENTTESAELMIVGISDMGVNENMAYTSTVFEVTGGAVGELTYNLSGADASQFNLDAQTRTISMTAKDFENPEDSNEDNVYEVTIEAEDEDGNMANVELNIDVVNVAEQVSLELDEIANASIDENTSYSSPTPAYTGTPQGEVSYSLSGVDAPNVSFDSQTGIVSLEMPNYENPMDDNLDNIYELTLELTDGDGNTDSVSWTITVNDVQEVSSLELAAYGDLEIEENKVFTSDPADLTGDPIGMLVYTIEGADASSFAVDSQTGVVTLEAQDFEAPKDSDANNVFEVTINAMDEDGNEATSNLNLTILDNPNEEVVDPGLEDLEDIIDGDGDISISDLESIEGLDGLESGNIDAYASTLNYFKDQLSSPPTLEEIQRLIDQVNREQANPQLPVTTYVGPTNTGDRNAWVISNLYKYPKNKVYIYNTWGKKVFETQAYQNDWRGIYEGQSEPLPAGSYFYQLDLNADGQIDQQGWVYISN
ncbi:MAG: gliding motility-associated C-terminal domain-containing protein [Flavobacteriaceae bacterium]|nr:gliding motility-associated C-terminal domain-containing protein [Flavobacteriaceae bacterium]